MEGKWWCKVIVNKPLVAIIVIYSLSQAPLRIQSLLIRLQWNISQLSSMERNMFIYCRHLVKSKILSSRKQGTTRYQWRHGCQFWSRNASYISRVQEGSLQGTNLVRYWESKSYMARPQVSCTPKHFQGFIGTYWYIWHKLREAVGLLFKEQRVIILRAMKVHVFTCWYTKDVTG